MYYWYINLESVQRMYYQISYLHTTVSGTGHSAQIAHYSLKIFCIVCRIGQVICYRFSYMYINLCDM